MWECQNLRFMFCSSCGLQMAATARFSARYVSRARGPIFGENALKL
jgi:hypothetical protein